ncbi:MULTISPECIES: CpsD/CapB family tyrosine-protein kinase [unclassified Fusibacter]|uniref:CpsD/CapB family tyrosine-protein kinase n=1 Tax=unclassified Fusibacter TaxID=2624464 RepID=UPI001011E00C|nr:MULTISPECIES: CpsD/CapB family tyrosine-protein kinase [unclassified Fusibacter]MCK8059900.1 CpsD/CapB family tyrosine-protein kinase [Fusibacter sp. A2]NPE23889.1 CpsD/CapB family tyrosine-protein kinase [Fusibacter sp. A1]RXV58481.1 capsular biosynthesis protein [Fusibacter sp. A1]
MKELIVLNHPKSPVAEAYRAIRTNIKFANVDQNITTMMVTSATAGEGKTTTLCNIAMTFVANGSKVLIVDCDLRKPRVHKFFEISNAKGVTDVLLNQEPYQEYVQQVVDGQLHVLTAGAIANSPSELLSSNAMKNLLEQLRSDYDYIFFDTPPVLPVTDAVILGTMIDGALLVCNSGVVKKHLAAAAKDKLLNVGTKLMGVVLNKIPMKGDKYHYYYYYADKEGV